MATTNDLSPGIYRHYKGKSYELLYIAYNSETLEKMVVYRALYESAEFPLGIWVRPLTMFVEKVEVVVEGRTTSVPRFARSE